MRGGRGYDKDWKNSMKIMSIFGGQVSNWYKIFRMISQWSWIPTG